jgi:hypothetical protein
MKPPANTSRYLAVALLAVAFSNFSPLATAQAVPPDATNVVQSVFVLPDNPKEGRDPFFPSSIRPYRDRPSNIVTQLSDLKLEGITRVGSRVFVIINDVTFGIGDDADVKTSTGGKVHVLCIQINADSVVVEVGGQTLTLKISDQ